MRYPSVADAQVQISWPPNMITITIQEREPALVWEQNGAAFWVDIQGNVMTMRSDRADLVRIIVDDPTAEIPVGSNAIDTDIVFGLLELARFAACYTRMALSACQGLGLP